MPHTVSHSVGDFDVRILTDGRKSFPHAAFPGASPEAIDALLARAGETEIRTNFNAVLVRAGGRTVLVDAGLRDLGGADAGNLAAGLAEAGTGADAVECLYLTHMHPDHMAGALTADGKPAFAGAELAMSRVEHEFWSDDARFVGAEGDLARWHALARQVLGAYAGRMRLIDGSDEIIPGMTQLPLPGHTPGHCGFRLASGSEEFVYVTDIVHAEALQFADPDISVGFDIDADTARETRKRMLDELADGGLVFSGAHLLQPALMRLERADGGFRPVRL